MQAGWRVGVLFGIPLFIDPSLFFILALLTLANGLRYAQWGTTLSWGIGLAMAVLLFGSVLLHELGHSLVAKSQGIKVNSITLFLFGGIAAIDQESKTPGKAFQVAIAGPAVSLGLFALLSLLAYVFSQSNTPVGAVAGDLAHINLVLALFNLIPGLPLDGGQVLKAAIWKVTGDRFQGTHWAAKAGKTLSWLAIILGVVDALGIANTLPTQYISGWWLALLGYFGLQNATAYDRMTELQETLLKTKAAEAMTRDLRVVDANMSLRQFADEYLLVNTNPPAYFAASDGRYRGMVMPDELRSIERSQWETQSLFSILRPLTEIVSVQETTSLVTVVQLLEAHQLLKITVLSPAGAVVGVIDQGDIVRALAQKLNIRISESMIKQIKLDGVYPSGLQLSAIARNLEDVVPGAAK